MNLHLFIPALFWPDDSQLEIYRHLRLPALETIFAKSRRVESSYQAIESWLCQTFGIEEQQDWPVAAIMLPLDGRDIEVGNDYWLRADPVHLRIENNHILLADSQMLAISLKEAVSFADTINEQFAGEGWSLLPLYPDRWYLRSSRSPDLQTYLLSEAAGKNINGLLPGGKDGAIWNSRINAIQMLLHDHPLNRMREARDELAINSLWIWGGGIWPQKIHAPYSEVWSDQVFARALAKASNIVCHGLPENAAELRLAAGSGERLVVLSTLQKYACYRDAYMWRNELMKLEQNWFAPLLHMLKKKQITRLTVTTINEHSTNCFTMTPNHLWKFWVTPRSLEIYS